MCYLDSRHMLKDRQPLRPISGLKTLTAKAWDKAEQTLAQIKERIILAGVPPKCVTTEIAKEEGDVVAQLIDAAATNGCNTIVVGRDNKSMFSKFLGGSVIEHLLRKPIGFTIWVVE
jgi:nucleotide-binding universal stress UspA family protein